MTAKHPTPQGISALLKRAGFDKSVNRPSRVKGLVEWCAGYHVAASMMPGCVLVEHRVNSLRLRHPSRAYDEAEKRKKYANVLADAGYAVTDQDCYLIVRAKED